MNLKKLKNWQKPNFSNFGALDLYVPCKQKCNLCANIVVAKRSFECLPTKRVYKVRRSTSCVSKNVLYIAFCLNCLIQGVRSTVD